MCPNHDDCDCAAFAGYLCVACLRHVAELVDGDVCSSCAPHWYALHYKREEWPAEVKILCGEHPAVQP